MNLHPAARAAVAAATVTVAVVAPVNTVAVLWAVAVGVLAASGARGVAWTAAAALPFSLLTAGLLALTVHGGATWTVAGVTFHAAGFWSGVTAGLRLGLALAGSLWFAARTPPRDLIALAQRAPRVAVSIAAVTRLSAAARADHEALVDARRVRGVARAGLHGRVVDAVAVLPALMVRAVRRGYVTEDALRAGGFGGARTSYVAVPWARADVAVIVASLGLAAAVIVGGW